MKKFGLLLNAKKTKIMDSDKSTEAKITIDGEELENVSNFCYLGAQIESNGKTTPNIKRRIAIATTKLQSMMHTWKSQSISLKLKVLKTCIFPVATYGCEAWTLTKLDEKKITAFEMKCYRKILRIPWTARRTNKSVLEELDMTDCELLNLIKKQKLAYFGHVCRHDTLEKVCLSGMLEGKRGRGRPRRRWAQDVSDWLGRTISEAGSLAQDRDKFRRAVWEATSKKDLP